MLIILSNKPKQQGKYALIISNAKFRLNLLKKAEVEA